MHARKQIEDLAKYYQEFHHRCMTWYILVLGLFIAGVISSPATSPGARFWIVPILVSAVFMGLVFFYYMNVYGARIDKLNSYLANEDLDPPKDWRTEHRIVSFGLHGVGAVFIVLVLSGLQAALFCLAIIKFYL